MDPIEKPCARARQGAPVKMAAPRTANRTGHHRASSVAVRHTTDSGGWITCIYTPIRASTEPSTFVYHLAKKIGVRFDASLQTPKGGVRAKNRSPIFYRRPFLAFPNRKVGWYCRPCGSAGRKKRDKTRLRPANPHASPARYFASRTPNRVTEALAGHQFEYNRRSEKDKFRR